MKRVTLATALVAAMAAGPVLAQSAPGSSPSSPSASPPAMAPMAPNPAAPAAPMGSTTMGSSAATAGAISYMSQQTDNQFLGSKLIGASVVGSEDSSIGEISDLLIGSTGSVEGVVVGVGGFLGMGQKSVAVPMQALQVAPDGNVANTPKITMQVTKAELQQAPEFKRANDNSDTATTGSITPRAPAGGSPAAPAPAR